MFYEIATATLAAAWLVTLMAYVKARDEANQYWGHVNALMDELNTLYRAQRNAVQRDPKTGRYLKKGH